MKERKFKQYFATVTVILLVLFLLFTIYKFINGFFGALLLYVVLFPFYQYLLRRKINKKVSASIVIFIALFVIIIPLVLVLALIGNEIFQIFKDPDLIQNTSHLISTSITKILPGMSQEVLAERLAHLSSYIGDSMGSLFLNIAISTGMFIINLVIAFFLLYFMLIHEGLYSKILKIIPFNAKNSRELVDELKDISRSTVLVGGIIALIQGGLLTIAFLIFGIKGAFIWGFVGAILSFLPIIGPAIVWIPACIILFVQGDYWGGGGLLMFGLVLSNVDNFLRPYLGRSIARVHPLITLIGVFIGISLFGLIGIFVGPLLLAFAVLVIKFYKEEYIN